jgi:hypothetical protein
VLVSHAIKFLEAAVTVFSYRGMRGLSSEEKTELDPVARAPVLSAIEMERKHKQKIRESDVKPIAALKSTSVLG